LVREVVGGWQQNPLGVIDEAVIGDKYRLLAGGLDERGMRRSAAAEALSLGRGGTAAVARATGIAESTIRRGRRELASEERPQAGRVRRPGAGRKPLTETDPTLLGDLERLVDDTSRGDPEAPLRWTAKSLRNLALGKVNPYGVYDVAEDAGWVSVGIDNDTAQFAVASIRGWWEQLGRGRYPDAETLTITADCGGSNGYRTRLWKIELQHLADETGLQICVCHFPPGTSKWNKIEHRLFSFISMNWRAKPLVSRQTVIDLIAATTTHTGLEVFAQLDERTYPKGIKVSDAELAAVKLAGNTFHPEWNYTIKPER
jgi:hypothetical protein